MKVTFKRLKKFYEVEHYIAEVANSDEFSKEEKEEYVNSLVEEYRKNGFIVVIA